MRRPPRSRSSRLLDRRVLSRAFGFLGPLEAAVSMAMLPLGAALFFAWQPGEALPAAGSRLATLSTMVFAAIVLMQMANALESRSETASLRALGPWSNRLLLGAIAAEFLALVGFVSVPGVRHVLGQAALGVREWLPIAITPWILLAAEETSKAVVRRRPKSSS